MLARYLLAPLFLLSSAVLGACSDKEDPKPQLPAPIEFASPGSLSAPSGKGSFRFGVATAATQIEDQNPNTDWYLWTAPAPAGLARGPFIGDAVKGYTRAIDDIRLLEELHLDSYRLSIEWARVEPRRNQIDESALAHYRQVIDALVARGIRPLITLHHFSLPVWIDDPRSPECAGGPSDTNLCGLDHPEGGELVAQELAEHARLLAQRFGDRVDEWGTLNEPVTWFLFAYGYGTMPPGKTSLQSNRMDKVALGLRHYLNAHVAMYRAIKAADTVDADGDGVAASVGLSLAMQDWVPVRDGKVSSDPADIAARDLTRWQVEYQFIEALRQGSFDSNLDGQLDEPHPEWRNSLDWLGVQHYTRVGASAKPTNVIVCSGPPCLEPLDPTYLVPAMGYETNPNGLYTMLRNANTRWPDLPLVVTEAGISTNVGARRAEMVVRGLEQIGRARAEGMDVRGYYHWSLLDNFEWTYGFTPRFGLYRVDYSTYERSPTEGATVLSEIAKTRRLSGEQRSQYGGEGPLTPEP